MDCKQCAEDLTAFIDGELSKSESERVQSHLAGCRSCSGEWHSLREASDFVESHNRELEPRDGSWNLVRARITAETVTSPSRSRIFPRWQLALATLAVVAVFALGYTQYQQVQRRNLDQYISRYIQERESRFKVQPVLAGAGAGSLTDNPYADNPFVEIKATVADNPFRSEDR